jgi:acetyl-CoA carboxylase biotin carboxyl carrier protein
MKLDIIAQIVQILKDAPEVGAIEIRRGLFGAWSSVRVSKAGHGSNATGHVVVTQQPLPGPSSTLPGGGGGGGGGGDAGRGTGPVAPAAGPQLSEIKSPMVGTFYQSPEPAAQPYVKVGSRVNVGQVVCIIEAMKIMNEIESEVSGVIREVVAQNAQPVEFGQVLFRVDPHG